MGVLKQREKEALLKELERKEVIIKDMSISWDGKKNLVIRFPKEIADYFGVNKTNRSKKKIRFIVKEKEGNIIREFDIIDIK